MAGTALIFAPRALGGTDELKLSADHPAAAREIALDNLAGGNWKVEVTVEGAEASKVEAGFAFEQDGSHPEREEWMAAGPGVFRISKWGGGIYWERDGKVSRFAWQPDSKSAKIHFIARLGAGEASATFQASVPKVTKISGPKAASHAPLARPFERHIFCNVIGWMNRFHYRNTMPTEYDLPIAPLDEGLAWDVDQIASHNIDVVTLDLLGAKRPSSVAAFYNMVDRWRDGIAKSNHKTLKFNPFWEYDTGGENPYWGNAGEHTGNPREAARFVGDMLAYFDLHYGADPALFHLEERPFHFLYNAMVYNRPAFWEAVRESLSLAGMDPVLSLGIGGGPMTVEGKLVPAELYPYTDRLFESVFLFQLWTKQADRLPTLLTRALEGNKSPIYVVGVASPGYWSVRQANQNYVDFRFTERLRETIAASLAAEVDGLHLTTWDDWQENTQFAPSFNGLDARLEILQAMTAAWLGKEAVGKAPSPRVIVTYRRTLRAGEPLAFEVLALPTAGFSEPVAGSFEVKNASGKTIAKFTTPPLDGGKCEAFLEVNKEASKACESPSALRIEGGLACGGKTFPFANLPEIAVLPADFLESELLYYSVPLHRLAGTDRAPVLSVNGVTENATQSGAVSYEVSVPGVEASRLRAAFMKNGHPLRMMAPVTSEGAEITPGHGIEFALKPGRSNPLWDVRPPYLLYPGPAPIENAYIGKRAAAIPTGGRAYYVGLVSFADGTYAYTPLVWAEPRVSENSVSALWVMAPDENGAVADFGPGRHWLRLESLGQGMTRDRLANGLPGISFSGPKAFVDLPINIIPPGPATVECVFQLRARGRPMNLLTQQGTQLAMRIDAEGRLHLERSDFDKNPVEVSSMPLPAGRPVCVAGVFTGSKLRLYVDGELAGEKDISSSRTTESLRLGGEGTLAFDGIIHKLAIYSGAVSPADLRQDFHDLQTSQPALKP